MKRRIQQSGFYITGEPDKADHPFHYAIPIRNQLAKYHEYVKRGNPKILPRLLKMIKKYPNIPAFRNYLSVYYAQLGNKEKAYKINREIVKRFPQYLIGKINLANQAIDRQEYDEVPKIIGDALDLKLLYPERNIFHYNEFTPFMSVVIRYLLETEQYEAAESRLPLLEEILGEEHDLVINLKNILKPEAFWGEFQETSSFTARTYDESLKTTQAPVYHHQIVAGLVDHTISDAVKLFPKLLALDHASLIQDLSTLLRDSLQRYHYWTEKDESKSYNLDFPVIALLLLGELEAEDQLPLLLDILRQGEDFLDEWYGDFLTEEWWKFLYPLAKNQLPLLVDFLQEKYNYAYSKGVCLTVLVQLALNEPDRKEEVIKHFVVLFESLLQEPVTDTSDVDVEFYSLLTAEVIALQDPRLKALSKKFYEAELVDEWIIGDWAELESDYLDTTYADQEKLVLPKSALENAQYLIKKWYN